VERFEGKAGDKIPAGVYETLDAWFAKKGCPTGAVVKEYKLNAEGKREGTSVAMLLGALKGSGQSFYYNMVYEIGREYWGWRLMDLSGVRDGLMADYDKTAAEYEKIKTRKAALNVWIRLYAGLRARGVRVKLSDFKAVGRESMEYHQKMLALLRAKCGVAFPNVI